VPLAVVTTLYKSVNERKKEIGTMNAIGTKPIYILSMYLNRIDWFYRSKSGIVSSIGLAYLLSVSGASGGGVYIAPIFLTNELVQV